MFFCKPTSPPSPTARSARVRVSERRGVPFGGRCCPWLGRVMGVRGKHSMDLSPRPLSIWRGVPFSGRCCPWAGWVMGVQGKHSASHDVHAKWTVVDPENWTILPSRTLSRGEIRALHGCDEKQAHQMSLFCFTHPVC